MRDELAPPMAMSERKMIARRAAFELRPNSVVNLGIGMPEGIAVVANEEKVIDLFTLTAEPGVIGGMPAGGLDFGAATNTQAIIDQPYQFDFYDGGGLDIAFLGLAQADRARQPQRQQVRPEARGRGRLHQHQPERQEGRVRRHVHGRQAWRSAVDDGRLRHRPGGEVPEVRRRGRASHLQRRATPAGAASACSTSPSAACLALTPDGLELIEIAPGVDLERDILAHMDFRPLIPRDPIEMDARIFKPEPMNLRADLVGVPLESRFTYDPIQNILFVNLERFALNSREDIAAIEKMVEAKVASLDQRVYAIVNYDNFTVLPELLDEYSAMVRGLMDRYYSGVSRYTTSGFLRMKLGESLTKRGVSPHIFENAAQARKDWREETK